MKMAIKDFFNTAHWTVTTITVRVANSLSSTVQDALLVEQCLRHCPLRRATVKNILSIILSPPELWANFARFLSIHTPK